MSVYRSRALMDGRVVSILPTWSDGAMVRAAAARAGRTDITVQDGEWHGAMPGLSEADAPQPTHQSYADVIADGLLGGADAG